MKESIEYPKLVFEEKKAISLFIWLFNFLYFIYDLFYYYIYPFYSSSKSMGIPKEGLGIWLYLLVLSLLPVSLYFIKKGNPFIVKYIYILGYVSISVLDDLLTYIGTTKPFREGNIVEILFFLFSPIFVNRKYFWIISSALIGKYLFFGIILKDLGVMVPIVIYIILSAIAYILLIRFNSYICSLTSAYEELRHKEKLALIGQMATAIGHEIRNPLASLKGFTQLQREGYPNTNDYYPIMIQEIDRINSIVNDLLYLGKPRAIKFDKTSIEEIVAYTLAITQQQAERQGVIIEKIIEGPISPIDCDEKQLKQVFINLIKNAIESMTDGGIIKINMKLLKEQKISISIEDEGCGIAEEHINNLGEPFFTTKKDGTGLGLMVTNQIIKDHNGEMKIESNLGKGSKVNVTLPMLQEK